MAIIRGPHLVSAYADADGNYRALNPKHHPGFVGYGRTPEEAKENLNRAIGRLERASDLAFAEAAFMVLSEADQARFIADMPKFRRS